ncbi:hypothetical protein [Metaclostridioides mangenotii]|uniref:hypothetical protein n=1 Tax=Metaclostridioides mangenotii TaxID=1540 RepID=UPI000463C76A|nr:hypothetical protein [Clostridioides mangenotii]
MRSKVLQMAAAEASKKYGKETVEAVMKNVDKVRAERLKRERREKLIKQAKEYKKQGYSSTEAIIKAERDLEGEND